MLAEKIVPLNNNGEEDSAQDGGFGYNVYFTDLNDNKKSCQVSTRRVVVSAGTFGTNELLLRCRDVFKTLPNINKNLGKHFSGNGDFLSFVVDGKRDADPNYGPVITQGTDYNLFKDFNRDHAFILEDASYPGFGAWYTEGMGLGFSHLHAFFRTVKLMFARFIRGITTGRVGYAFNELLKGDLSYRTSVLLCMGLDRSDGDIHLDKNGNVRLHWPYRNSMSLYKAILTVGRRFKERTNAKAFAPLPNWLWPFRSNVTVHALGGCRLSENSEHGVTSADPETIGQVFGYKGLYVADGSILPTGVGANPIATISALSERIAEGITGIKPDADL